MGVNDNYLNIYYTNWVANKVDLRKVKSIAWLGWTSPNVIVESIEYHCPNLEKSSCFDIVAGDPQTIEWDINKEWNITGYDLVICLRTTMFVTDKETFLNELKKATEANGTVIMDFWLPEIKRFSDFHQKQREHLRLSMGYSEKIEYYFGWDCPVFNMTVPLEDYISKNRFHPAGSTKDRQQRLLRPDQPISARISFMQFGGHGGYNLIPAFPTLFEHAFSKAVGFEYNHDVVGYPTSNETLTERDMHRHGLDAEMSLMYTLNHIPPEVGLNLDETEGEYIPMGGHEYSPPGHTGPPIKILSPNYDKKFVIIGSFMSIEK